MNHIKLFFTHLFFIAFALNGLAQNTKTVEILNANNTVIDEKRGKDLRMLIGDVRLKHEDALMFCDSAYIYSDSKFLEAFGDVEIQHGDTVNLTGKYLKYNGNTRICEVEDNVRLINNETILTTENKLIYNMTIDEAYYENYGVIEDTTNTLESKKGRYNTKSKKMYFRDSVYVHNENYKIYSDSIDYNSQDKIIVYRGPSHLYTDSSYVYAERGWYSSIVNTGRAETNIYLKNESTELWADSLFIDKANEIAEAYYNVQIRDSLNNYLINGEKAIMNQKINEATVTGLPYITYIIEQDSMFIHADTLFSYQNTQNKKVLNAYHDVKLFKSDIQAKCDSLSYNEADSLIEFFHQPVLWSEANQITGDSIQITIKDQAFDKLYVVNHAFMISEEDSTMYNQIKGKLMIGHFVDNALNKINVIGNGQSIYYSKDEKENITGVNKADCSNMIIHIKDNQVSSLSMLVKPDGTYYPTDQFPENLKRLKDFKWRGAEKPLEKADIFK